MKMNVDSLGSKYDEAKGVLTLEETCEALKAHYGMPEQVEIRKGTEGIPVYFSIGKIGESDVLLRLSGSMRREYLTSSGKERWIFDGFIRVRFVELDPEFIPDEFKTGGYHFKHNDVRCSIVKRTEGAVVGSRGDALEVLMEPWLKIFEILDTAMHTNTADNLAALMSTIVGGQIRENTSGEDGEVSFFLSPIEAALHRAHQAKMDNLETDGDLADLDEDEPDWDEDDPEDDEEFGTDPDGPEFT